MTSKQRHKKMADIANKINKAIRELSVLSYEIKMGDNTMALSDAETDSLICDEAADMLGAVCKHITSTGTKY